jgi:hypothetical protein
MTLREYFIVVTIFLGCIGVCISKIKKLHIVSHLDLTIFHENDQENLLRLYSSLFIFSDEERLNEEIECYLSVYYNSTNYFLNRIDKLSYHDILHEKYNPKLEYFDSETISFLESFLKLGILLSFVPIEEINLYNSRYTILENRKNLMRLYSSLYLGRRLLTNSDFRNFDAILSQTKFDPRLLYEDFILYLDPDFIVASGGVFKYIKENSASSDRFEFHSLPFYPKVVKNTSSSNLAPDAILAQFDYYNTLYNLQVHYISLPLTLSLSFFVHTTLLTNSQSLGNILQSGINTLTETGIKIINLRADSFPVVYSQRPYSPPPGQDKKIINEIEEIQSLALIEFDGINHQLKLLKDSCTIRLYIEWVHFNTVQIIRKFFQFHFENNQTKLNYFSSCLLICFQKHCDQKKLLLEDEIKERNQELLAYFPLQIENSYSNQPNFIFKEFLSFRKDVLQKTNEEIYTPKQSSSSSSSSSLFTLKINQQRVFDCILFFNELSMLELRLRMMSPLVTKHLIIESKFTFTGKPKNITLTSMEAQRILRPYRNKIDIIILDSLPFLPPQIIGDIWQNEYFSRNYFHKILIEKYSIQSDDILLIGDTDEIIDPEILLLTYAMFDYAAYQRKSKRRIVDQETRNEENPLPLSSSSSSSSFPPKIITTDFYKLILSEYLYDFHCYINTIFNYFPASGPTTIITTFEKSISHAKEIFTASPFLNIPRDLFRQYDEEGKILLINGIENHFFFSRNYYQYLSIVPYELMISNYVWHLSFFHNFDYQQTKEKLESYSHQNFARQFFDEDDHDDHEKEEEGKEKEFTLLTNADQIPQGNISIDLLAKRIQSKRLINGKEFRSKYKRNRAFSQFFQDADEKEEGEEISKECQEPPFDLKTILLERTWENILQSNRKRRRSKGGGH